MNFSNDEQERYLKQLNLAGFGESAQNKLRAGSILVIGAGGLGCPVLIYLAVAGIGKIGIVDEDVVELSNLHRQILYTGADIGKNKAQCAAKHLQEHNPHVQCTVYSERLTSANASDLINKYDLVVDCTDNFPTRYLVNDTCVLFQKPWVFGSVSRYEGQLTVFNHDNSDGSRSGTLRCLFPEPPASINNCDDDGVLGVLPGMIGVMMASEAIKVIADPGNTLAGTLLTMSSTTMQFQRWNYQRNPSGWHMPGTLVELKDWEYGEDQLYCTSEEQISTEEFVALMQNHESDLLVLDVRELAEQPRIQHPSVLNIPINELEQESKVLIPRTYNIVVCASGSRSLQAIKLLQRANPAFVWRMLAGGIRAMPVQFFRKASLENLTK